MFHDSLAFVLRGWETQRQKRHAELAILTLERPLIKHQSHPPTSTSIIAILIMTSRIDPERLILRLQITLLLKRNPATRVKASLVSITHRARPERDVIVVRLIHRDGISHAMLSKAAARARATVVMVTTAIQARDVERDRFAALAQIPYTSGSRRLAPWRQFERRNGAVGGF